VAVVTGGSAGIGKAATLAFAALGVRVVVTARRTEKLAGVVDGHSLITAVAGDVRGPDDVDRAVAVTVDRFGRLDVVVNNAGVFAAMPLADADAARVAKLFAVNVVGTTLLTRAALPFLRPSHGSVVNISGAFGTLPAPGAAHYGGKQGRGRRADPKLGAGSASATVQRATSSGPPRRPSGTRATSPCWIYSITAVGSPAAVRASLWTGPGATALTRTPSGANSSETVADDSMFVVLVVCNATLSVYGFWQLVRGRQLRKRRLFENRLMTAGVATLLASSGLWVAIFLFFGWSDRSGRMTGVLGFSVCVVLLILAVVVDHRRRQLMRQNSET
jgi:hypothetical protein